MSLSAIINAGQSALIAAQTQMSVASTNITNASTEGYTTKTASTATTTVSGQAVGVAVTAIGNQISAALQAEVMSAASEARYDETLAAYLETALTALGTTSSGAPLEEAMTALSDALAEAVSDGGTTSATAAVADALAVWAETLNTTAADLEAVARTVESDLAKSVDSVNALLQTLDTLNDQITAATAAGRSTADLLDSQRSALEELSGYLDIASYTASSGDLYIYSADGQALLTSTPRTLSYDAAGGIAIDGEDVGTKLGGGSIGALLELHDTVLPGLQDELDSLAVTVMEAVNAAANAASPVPAPATLTSAGTLDAAAAFAGSGTLAVLLTDGDGVVTGSAEIDLAGLSTYQDLVDALDAVSGVSASLDGDGRLTLAADDGTSGLVLAGDGTVDADGRSLAHHLGVNSLLQGSGAADMAVAESLETQGVPLAQAAATATGETALVAGDTTGLQALWTSVDTEQDFPASGALAATEATPITRIASLIDSLADRTATASDTAEASAAMLEALATSFDNTYGVNVDEETAKLVVLEQSYESAAQILATAQEMFDSLIAMMQ